jgi:hypothetical protein
MTPRRPWHQAVLGACALVFAIIGIGLILEHTVGPSWAGSGDRPKAILATAHARFAPTTTRIPSDLRRELRDGRRLGARYGGSDFSDIGRLHKAISVQVGIGAIVVAIMMAWRRLRSRRNQLARARSHQELDS